MAILGHGIDIVETSRIRRLVEQHGQHFLDRCFTRDEQAYCALNEKRYYEHLAGRFAAKEAVLKVLGTGWRGGIAWTDVEVIRESSGQPKIALTGEVARVEIAQINGNTVHRVRMGPYPNAASLAAAKSALAAHGIAAQAIRVK